MNLIDIIVQNYFVSIRTQFLTEAMYLLTILFNGSLSFLVIVLCVATLIYLVRNFRYAMLFVFSLFSGTLVVFILKSFFDVNRPTDGLAPVFGQSFPSYHATIATIFFVMLIYIFDDYLKKRTKIVFNTLCIFSVILVSFSRLYLGAHWLSDVVSGLILGVLISYISIKIFKSRKNIQR